MTTRYVQPHVTQFDGGKYQSEACVPASIANGVGASTGGARRPTSAAVHAVIPKTAETDPHTAGWSEVDASRAAAKMGIPYTALDSWNLLEAAHDAGHYIRVIGDSDVFADSTCSGAFNGDHSIGVHPNERVLNGVELWWIDDPICKTGRWEAKTVIKRYADKLAGRTGRPVRGGRFDTKVPLVAAPPTQPTVVLRYGGARLTPRQVKRIKVPSGRRANVRTRPDRIRTGDVVAHLANGKTFTAYQRTKTGVSLAGSRVWYGNATGTRWLHVSSF